jgi:hypothetical protein
MIEDGLTPELLLAGKYGHCLTCQERKMVSPGTWRNRFGVQALTGCHMTTWVRRRERYTSLRHPSALTTSWSRSSNRANLTNP